MKRFKEARRCSTQVAWTLKRDSTTVEDWTRIGFFRAEVLPVGQVLVEWGRPVVTKKCPIRKAVLF